MTFRDLLVVSIGNLRRMKLRTFLTTSGIIIAITAFVALLSFGAGTQQNIDEQFNKFGLFWTMQVYPYGDGRRSDTTARPDLDAKAVERIAAVPGVNLVYPYDSFSVLVRAGDSTKASKAQALSSAAMQTKLMSNLVAGTVFDSNDARQVIISRQLASDLGFKRPDSALGVRLIVAAKVSVLDSALAHVIVDRGETILSRLRRIHLDSLLNSRYRSRVIRVEAGETVRRFISGFLTAQESVRDTLTICGIRETSRGGAGRIDPVIIPLATAQRFGAKGPGGGPTEIFAAMSKGTLFGSAENGSGKTFPQVTLEFDPKAPYKQVRDSVQAMGFRVFSFAEQFEQLQEFFLYFDLGLAVIGLIALLTASLGIVNTMVMSITERRREIGILKSLGADEPDIRRLFLVESGAIGAMGTVIGILLGWVISRVITLVAQTYMRNQGIPETDLFALPPWLLLIALAVGIGVSILAGWYPAARAARVDPVEALRAE